MKEITQIELIKRAYNLGTKDCKDGGYTSFYTPRLQLAYNLGYSNIPVDFDNVVSGYRYGECPERASWNYASNTWEDGVSLAALDGEKEVGSSVWFADREKVQVRGLLIASKGSDGEPLVVPLDMTEQYDF
ncbi:MAG: hypothetical protein J5732_00805 [Bacteroidaceae bacterium]|nr:hypothetical protein [Bacteroidaceae bacterium]